MRSRFSRNLVSRPTQRFKLKRLAFGGLSHALQTVCEQHKEKPYLTIR
jgi:hypothetical protein